MKKKILGLIAISSFIFTACSSSSAGISFNETYQIFHYKGKNYAITKQRVKGDSIRTAETRFMEWPVVKEKGRVKETVSLNNLYVTSSDQWVIGIQGHYYKVELASRVAESDRIDYQKVLDEVGSQNYLKD
ncbi:NisI/SpaI family lantibiotic immunity lipoprotein [Streptococcus ruminantium]|uniref:NisI/SpaI family lantibiotic immunity lipoprotein n=1 Tax=Streptococcus ruminantium TaxID=1917441 RepID=UPI0012DFA41F|nr:NisI/SpaI family lantibiotic immunity lipoprotein [Streptococcus ruminantium]